MYETILSPINYGGLQLKNRIIFAPTTFGLSDEEYLARIRSIAEGGCAMIIVGDVPVGKSKFEKSLFDSKGFAFYQKIVEIAHDADCKVCAQLHQSDSNLLAMFKYIPGLLLKKITPDQLREKLNAEVAPYITNMSQRKIHEIISGFGKAAALAKQAGFDMVQVHGDRMCGSFSSAIFNHRADEYGGSAENRFRFVGECLTAIRQAVGADYPVLIKVNTNCAGDADEAYAQDILYFCRQFQALGADAIELSGYNWIGLGKKKVPTFYLDRAAQIRKEVTIPLILVGGVRGPESIQKILDAGIDFVSASRPFICQPDFLKHLEAGEDSACIGCTKCLGNIWAKEGRRCVKHEIPPEFANKADN